MQGLTWDTTEDIAMALYEQHPELDPLTVRFTDLHKWVTQLEEFEDDPGKSTRRQTGGNSDGLARRVRSQSIIRHAATGLSANKRFCLAGLRPDPCLCGETGCK